MKIGIVCYPTYGGSGIVATELGLGLARRGAEVHFISYSAPTRLGSFNENVYFHEVEFPHYPLFEFHMYSLALAGKIIEIARNPGLDILHVHYAVPHAVSGFLSKEIISEFSEMKLVTTLHGTDITLTGIEPAFFPLVKFAIEKSDAVTAVSDYLRKKTIETFKVENNISVIPNFIDTSVYKRSPAAKIREKFAPRGEKILLHVSNFRKLKRAGDCVKILSEVNKKIPAKLLLAGEGPEIRKVRKTAEELRVADKVVFLGRVDALAELLSSADVFLLPSQSESFGLSALEAMSCGVPVVASAAGGLPELVEHGESGYLAEPGDYTKMAAHALDLLSDDKKWSAFSEKCREIASEKFNAEKIIPAYEKLYVSLF